MKQTTDSHSHASVADADTATSSGITINTKLWEGKWTEVTQPPPNSRAWVDDNYNDQVVLTFFKKRPDITAPLSDLATIWKSTRVGAFWNQGAPISISGLSVDGVPAYRTIMKFYSRPGYIYQALITIPFRDCSYVLLLRCDAREDGEDREKAALKKIQDTRRGWYNDDPFGFKFVSPIAANASDELEWDTVFPSHALSRLRRHLNIISESIQLSERARRQPLFETPDDSTETLEEIRTFSDLFSLSDSEREQAVVEGQALTRRVVEILSRCSSPVESVALADGTSWRPIAGQLHNEIVNLASRKSDDKICLIIYSGHVDQKLFAAMKWLGKFYAERDNTPEDAGFPDEMASQNFRHWEYLFSRWMAAAGYRCVALRLDDFEYQQFGVSLVEASVSDWIAKFMVLAELADIIFSASFFNTNLTAEIVHVYGDPRLRKKFIYRSTHHKFLYAADEQSRGYSVYELPILALHVANVARQALSS